MSSFWANPLRPRERLERKGVRAIIGCPIRAQPNFDDLSLSKKSVSKTICWCSVQRLNGA
jgi:hypothetical protein